MKYIDRKTGYLVCDSATDPLRDIRIGAQDVQKALESYILSASGWRNIFAASKDEEDADEHISDADAVITAHIAKVLYDSLGVSRPRILLAAMTRS